MSELDTNLAILYALLHDIGKPILRYLLRRDNLERVKNENAESLIRSLIHLSQVRDLSELISRRHEALSEDFIRLLIKELGLTINIENIIAKINDIVLRSDRASAIERGLLPSDTYKRLWDKVKEVVDGLIKDLGSTYDFNHHTSPMFSPLWRIYYSGYEELVGPCATSSAKSLSEGYLQSTISRVLKNFEEGYFDEISRAELNSLFNSKYWIPVKPLTFNNILTLKTCDIKDAIKDSSYGDVVGVFYRLTEDLVSVYRGLGLPITRGFLNTLESALQVTMSFVPSAVWATVIPDISLYAHLKNTAALSHVYLNEARARLLRVELNGIQDFISSVVTERAASRVLRGRSFLVELLQDSITKLMIEFLGLTKSSVLVFEGGGITLIVPGSVDYKLLEHVNKSIYEELYKTFHARLWVTSTLSEAFDLMSLKGVEHPESEFAKVVRKLLEEDVLVNKVRAQGVKLSYVSGKPVRRLISGNSMDSLTYDVVYEDDDYYLRVELADEYVKLLAPDKLKVGDLLSSLTHLSLVCGSTARNLIAVLAIRAYKKDSNLGRYVPDHKLIEYLTNHLMNVLKETTKTNVKYVMMGYLRECRSPLEECYTVGLVPFKYLGTLYLLVSLKSANVLTYSDPKALKTRYEASLATLLMLVKDGIEEALKRLGRGTVDKVVIEFKAINNPEGFVLNLGSLNEGLRALREVLSKIGIELDVEFSPYFINTYHPVSSDLVKLKDLDEMGLISLSKLDVDMAGEVIKLYTYYPSRLIDFSNILTIAFNMKTYLMLLEDISKGAYAQRGIKDVVVLYSGGDDACVYGRWDEVLLFTIEIYDKVVKDLLKPLSISIGVSMGKSKTPILQLYRATLNHLRRAKAYRRSVSMDLLEAHTVVKCDHGKEIRIVNSIPLECNDISEICVSKSVANILKLSNVERLREMKSIIYSINEIISMLIRYEHESRGGSDERNLVVPLIYYAYLCARRFNEIRELADILKTNEIYDLPVYSQDVQIRIEDMYPKLLESKPLFDLMILKLRSD